MASTPASSASGSGVRLGHVALAVGNPDRLEAFYRDLIGLTVVRRGGNAYTGGAVLFSGRPAEEDHELVLLANPQAAHVAFRAPTRTALAGFYRRAVAAAVAMPLPPQDFGVAWSVFVTDPEGHPCEVYWATGRPPAPPRPLDPTVLQHPQATTRRRPTRYNPPPADPTARRSAGMGSPAMCHDPDSAPPLRRGGPDHVVGEKVILTAADDARFQAFAARPETPSGAAVVVLPDVRGLTGFYGELALRLAEHGHAAVAIDYYGRTAGVGPRVQDFPFLQHVGGLSRPTLQADVAAAVARLRSPEGGACRRVFTLGFCLGGRTSWLSATTNELAGAIGFYGAPGVVGPYRDPGPTQLADRLRAPVLALMGGADDGIPPSEVHAFDTALTTAGVEHEIVVYPGAPHGFFDVRHAEFADACADAWQRILAFIGRRPHHTAAGLDERSGSVDSTEREVPTSSSTRGEG